MNRLDWIIAKAALAGLLLLVGFGVLVRAVVGWWL